MDLATQYQRKTDKQHILDNPDTYIGAVENVDEQMWVFDETTQQIVLKNIEYVPGLYKLFDEATGYIFGVLDASIERTVSAQIIDSDQQRLFGRLGNIDGRRHLNLRNFIVYLIFNYL